MYIIHLFLVRNTENLLQIVKSSETRGQVEKAESVLQSTKERCECLFFVILLLLMFLLRRRSVISLSIASNKKVLLKDFPSGSTGSGRRIMPIISVKTEPSLLPPNVSQETAKTETSLENTSKNDFLLYGKH